MSVKLAKAVARRSVVVKNVMSGEVSLVVNGQNHLLGRNQKLDLTALVGNPKECMGIKGLQDMLKRGQLVLL